MSPDGNSACQASAKGRPPYRVQRSGQREFLFADARRLTGLRRGSYNVGFRCAWDHLWLKRPFAEVVIGKELIPDNV